MCWMPWCRPRRVTAEPAALPPAATLGVVVSLHLAQESEADAFISEDPLALLIAIVLD